jgi:TonB family protein
VRTRLSLVAGLVFALASTCFGQQPPIALAASVLALLTLPPALARAPDDKSHNPLLDREWTKKTVDSGGLRVVVSFPPEWMVLEQASGAQMLQLMSLNGGRFAAVLLTPFRPVPVSLNAPIPADMLTQFARVIGTEGVTVSGTGQAKLGSRYWMWAEALAPEAVAGAAGLPGLAFDRFRVWMFNTTEAGQMVSVNLTVGMPQGSTTGDTEAEVHAAADVFLEILHRMTLEPGTPPPVASPADSNSLPKDVVTLGQNGVTIPTVVKQVRPAYTADAMRAHLAGTVVVECVVETDGSVGSVRVRRSLDAVNGLDDEAVKAAKQWRFRPGTKDGVPVRVLVTIELSFTLREKPPTPPPSGRN